jgi:hypothetical protein
MNRIGRRTVFATLLIRFAGDNVEFVRRIKTIAPGINP